MIVPSMNYFEIRQEVDKDLVFVKKKSQYVIDELAKKMKKKKLKTLSHIYDYYSPNKNKWMVKIEIGLVKVETSFITYFYVDNKIVAVEVIATPFLLYYTTHFFKRYRERLKLDIIKPEDLIRKYLSDSTNFTPKVLENVNNNLMKMYIICKKGTILGTFHKDAHICKMNTFLSPEMLKTDQIEMENEMKGRLTKYSKDTGRLD